MDQDLIKRYPPGQIARKDLFKFLADLYRSGKSREFISFAIWESLHRAGLFPARSYLKFADSSPLMLKGDGDLDEGLDRQVRDFFSGKRLAVTRSAHNWKRVFISARGDLFGYVNQGETRLYRSIDQGETTACVGAFPKKIKSIFVSSRNVIFVSIKGSVYRSAGRGEAFEKVIDLASPESYVRHDYAMTETPDGMLIIGEYGNVWEQNHWKRLPYLYFSSDSGKTWQRSDFLIQHGINKHVHLVRYSWLLGKLLLTDGDNKKKLWLADLPRDRCWDHVHWKPITRFHIQTGGYTSVVESGDRVLFGTDYQGGTNFLVETQDGRKFSKRIMPDPYRRSPIHSLSRRKSREGDEIWANSPISTGSSRSLLMFSRDGGASWDKLIEYNSKLNTVSLMGATHEAGETLYCAIKDLSKNTCVAYRISDP